MIRLLLSFFSWVRGLFRRFRGEWWLREYPIVIADVPPERIGGALVALMPVPCGAGVGAQDEALSFRPDSVVAASECASHFRLVQCSVGRSVFAPDEIRDAVFPIPLEGAPVAEIGTLVALHVVNVSDEARTFTGAIVGRERVR